MAWRPTGRLPEGPELHRRLGAEHAAPQRLPCEWRRRPRRGHVSRGLAFPGKPPFQGKKIGNECIRDRDKWGFFCKVDWQMLVNEQSRHPDDPELKKRVDVMSAKFGSDVPARPDVVCGTKFAPRAKGSSMVAEIKNGRRRAGGLLLGPHPAEA